MTRLSRLAAPFALAALLTVARPPVFAALGPVAPTEEVLSKVKATGKSLPDLPYKPLDPEEIEAMASDSDSDNDAGIESHEEVIEWEKIPYVPFKRPSFRPAPDPGY